MYSFFLTLHSLIRWVVVVVAVVTVFRGVRGWIGKRDWEPLDERLGLFFSIAVDVQVLLGLLLYMFLSPITTTGLSDFGQAMADSAFRFWTTEHAIPMIVALILVHVGRAVIRRATQDSKRHRWTAIFFGLATLVILLAIPWPFSSQARPLVRLG